jgi:hypothetical protein
VTAPNRSPKGRPPAAGLAITAVFVMAGIAMAHAPDFTTLRLFTPHAGGRLAEGVTVTERVEGACFARSVASPERPDAWRCSSENAILDPCFLDLMGDPRTLACAGSPFSTEVVELALTSDLPEDPASSRDPSYGSGVPWALVLADGQLCTLLTGATAPVAGLRIAYGCGDGSSVAGPIDRTLPMWRVFHVSAHRTAAVEQVVIVEAWF